MRVNIAILKIIMLLMFSLTLSGGGEIFGQAVPGKDENIPFLVTFGKIGDTSWGDDDFSSETSFFYYSKGF